MEYNVPFENEPRRRAPLIEWLRAYFAADSDEEEHIAIYFDFTSTNTVQIVRRIMLALVALYDSATSTINHESDPHRLLRHYQTITGGKRRLR